MLDSCKEHVNRNTHGLESYITARDLPVHHQYQEAELFTLPDLESDLHKDGIEQPMFQKESLPVHSYTLCFWTSSIILGLSNESSHDAGHQRNTCRDFWAKLSSCKYQNKKCFLPLLENGTNECIHRRTLDTTLKKSFDGLYYSESFTNALVKKVHRHPAPAQDPAEPMVRATKRKIEDWVELNDKELIKTLLSETESSSTASHDSSMKQGDPRLVPLNYHGRQLRIRIVGTWPWT